MLVTLQIQNIVLVEEGSLEFGPGLNVLTGETGAGKSAIMAALSFLLGEKTKTSMIRHGEDLAVVEATFDCHQHPRVHSYLETGGIDSSPDDPLVIRRDLSRAGKSRCFINQQRVQRSFLQGLGGYLVDIVGQHSSQKLLHTPFHRELLDIYAKLEGDCLKVAHLWKTLGEKRKQVLDLEAGQAERKRQCKLYQDALEEIDAADLRKGEEEELFAEYTRLSHSEELNRISQELYSTLGYNTLSLLKQGKIQADNLLNLDENTAELNECLTRAVVEIEEASYFIRSYVTRIEFNPDRMAQLDERLALIHNIKNKYGQTWEELSSYQEQLASSINELDLIDDEVISLNEELVSLSSQYDTAALTLSEKRHKAASTFDRSIVAKLKELSMPKAELNALVEPTDPSPTGIDSVSFLFRPNHGEQASSLSHCASGGELSRVMLAIKTVLSTNDSVVTVVFDEIDSGIGGETAARIGDALKVLSTQSQVMCITHLPQVAHRADQHFEISKVEKNNRTYTLINKLDGAARCDEMTRMLGGERFDDSTRTLAQNLMSQTR